MADNTESKSISDIEIEDGHGFWGCEQFGYTKNEDL